MKRCSACDLDMAPADFWPGRAQCIACFRRLNAARMRERNRANPEAGREANRRWYWRNRERALVLARARKRSYYDRHSRLVTSKGATG